MKFTIIIPLEFHRGLAERCVRGWSMDQTYRRDDFEILIAAPETHDAAEIELLAQLLGSQDRIIKLPHQHDMPLVAEAVREARGEVLIFTEAHCLPEPDFLAQSATVLDEHAEWAGFSGRSIPVTHNLLSEIEAEMYDHEISHNLQTHPWLKVLDQCFIIRREAYQTVGGIEPQYGHFAEWLIAARFHRGGFKIGYDPRPAIRHYYIGDLHELEEFTRDFSAGQMRFAHAAATDPCGDLFDEVPEWTQRYQWNRQVAARLMRLLARDIVRVWREQDGRSLWKRIAHWPWTLAGMWIGRRCFSLRATLAWLRLELWQLRRATKRHLRSGEKQHAKVAFLRLMAACVRAGRLEYLASLPQLQLDSEASPTSANSEWTPGAREVFSAVGFHNLEMRERMPFRWSEPVAIFALPPLKGDWKISIEWARFKPLAHLHTARFYVNDRPIAATEITHLEEVTEFKLRPTVSGALRLSWVCDSFPADRDARQLGLPVSRVSWTDVGAISFREPPSSASTAASVYFLHVPKCAGTTTRQLLLNVHAAAEILSPYNVGLYYEHQLKDHPEIHDPYLVASGHFGWDLPSQVSNRPWRVVTMLRDPLGRLASLFDYLRQHQRLPRELAFATWLEREFRPTDLLFAHFVNEVSSIEERGVAALSKMLSHHLPTAISNLRKCEVVGLQERMDDSINLLCATLDRLPPPQVPRVNVTMHRTRGDEIAPEALQLFKQFLRPELEFYETARSLFEAQLVAMHRDLELEAGEPLDTDAARRFLRLRYFQRHSQELSGQTPQAEFNWQPDHPFIGSNLHDRERHAGENLRWTGPAPKTVFYAAIDTSRRASVALKLHPATPSTHAAAARLYINGEEVSLQCQSTDAGFKLTGLFEPAAPPTECGLFSEFNLLTPTKRGAGEFREIGVALTGIEIHAVTNVVPRPHFAQQFQRVE